jgi:hypothetical protein
VNARSWSKLEKLATKCAEALRDPARQSESIFRGDMWAVISAHHEIRKARESLKKVTPSHRMDSGDPVRE